MSKRAVFGGRISRYLWCLAGISFAALSYGHTEFTLGGLRAPVQAGESVIEVKIRLNRDVMEVTDSGAFQAGVQTRMRGSVLVLSDPVRPVTDVKPRIGRISFAGADIRPGLVCVRKVTWTIYDRNVPAKRKEVEHTDWPKKPNGKVRSHYPGWKRC